MRGRKKKPAALRRLEGNRSKRPIVEPLVLPLEIPEPPWTLTRLERREWDRMAAKLHGSRLLTGHDAEALATYCQVIVRFHQANQQIEKFGVLILDEDGVPACNPAVKIAADCVRLMRAYQVEFGGTPSARMRVRPAGGQDPEKPANEFDAFLAERRAAGGA